MRPRRTGRWRKGLGFLILGLSFFLKEPSLFATKRQEEEESPSQNTLTVRDFFTRIPQDTWLAILRFSEFEKRPYPFRLTLTNTFFWSLITGYPRAQILDPIFAPPPFNSFPFSKERCIRVRNSLEETLKTISPACWFSFVTEIKNIDSSVLSALLTQIPLLGKRVKSLTLTQDKINFPNLKALLEQNPSVRNLTLWYHSLKEEEVKSLGQVPTVQALDLSHATIGPEILKSWALSSKITSLTLVKSGLEALEANCLLNIKSLTFLNISFNNIRDEGAISLAQHSALETLSVWHNTIGKAGGKALSQNVTLTSLDVGCNQIGQKWATALQRRHIPFVYLNLGCGHEAKARKESLEVLRNEIYEYTECLEGQEDPCLSPKYFYTRYLLQNR